MTNMGGDSDSVGAVAGQILGALYGYKLLDKKLVNHVLKWDK